MLHAMLTIQSILLFFNLTSSQKNTTVIMLMAILNYKALFRKEIQH